MFVRKGRINNWIKWKSSDKYKKQMLASLSELKNLNRKINIT